MDMNVSVVWKGRHDGEFATVLLLDQSQLSLFNTSAVPKCEFPPSDYASRVSFLSSGRLFVLSHLLSPHCCFVNLS